MRGGGRHWCGGPKQNKTGRKVGESKVEMIEIRRRCAADKRSGEERRGGRRDKECSRADGAKRSRRDRRGGSTISVLLLRVYSGTTAAN